MVVVFLTHYFPPEVGAPQTRIAALAAGLAARGHRVTVHTGLPHYPDGRIPAPYRLRPLARERRDGYRVIRSPVLPLPNRGVLPRLADHGAFATGALACAPLVGRADVVVAETPPLALAVAAVPYARMLRARLVLHVADLWPASAVALGVLGPGAALRAAERLERAAYRGADALTAPTRGVVAALEAHPAAGGRVHHHPPSVDLARFDPAPPDEDGPLRVLYAGTVGLAQSVETLVEAARRAADAVRVTIAGAGAELEAVRAAARDVATVRVLGAVPAERVPELYRDADVGAVLLRDAPLFAGALPSKLLEVLAAGRAALLAARGEAAALVRDAGAGAVVAPEDPGALAAALAELARDRAAVRRFGAAGRAYAERELDVGIAVARWERLLSAVASASASATRSRSRSCSDG